MESKVFSQEHLRESLRYSKGYCYVYAPYSKGAKKSGSYKGFIFKHRLVMEQKIGRPLRKEEDVHHLDFNPLNNNPENLLLLTKGEHTRLHYLLKNHIVQPQDCYDLNYLKKILQAKQRKCIDCGVELSIKEYSKSRQNRCKDCYNRFQRKVIRPTKDELINALQGNTMVAVAKQFGVSNTTIKKWVLSYGINYKELIRQRRFCEEAQKNSQKKETREKIGKALSEWHKKNLSSSSRAVLCLNKKMEVIREYKSISHARKDGFLDSPISRCCRGKSKSYKGYLWRYKEDFEGS